MILLHRFNCSLGIHLLVSKSKEETLIFVCFMYYFCVLNTTTTTTTILRPFVRDYPSEPVPEETLTHPTSWSSCNFYQLLPSTMIH